MRGRVDVVVRVPSQSRRRRRGGCGFGDVISWKGLQGIEGLDGCDFGEMK